MLSAPAPQNLHAGLAAARARPAYCVASRQSTGMAPVAPRKTSAWNPSGRSLHARTTRDASCSPARSVQGRPARADCRAYLLEDLRIDPEGLRRLDMGRLRAIAEGHASAKIARVVKAIAALKESDRE